MGTTLTKVKRVRAGGGLQAVRYAFKKAREAGGSWHLWKALRSRNACKTCALGMGGQLGGMVNETGHFPEVCKKSIQAMVADMQGRIGQEFFDQFDFDKLSTFTSRELEASGRIADPLYARPYDTTYQAISWDEAIDRVTKKLKETPPDESFFYFSGRSSNEAGFLLQLFARLYGTNNVNNCSYYCHQASGVGLASAVGSGTATIVLDDIEHCDLLFIIGANPASNHPRLMTIIKDMKRRGGKVVVINPLKELGLVRFRVPSDVRSMIFGTDIADLYVQPHIGGDIAFLTGVSKALLEFDSVDHGFLERSTEGWPDLKQHLQDTGWKTIEATAGVPKQTMIDVAKLYAGSNKSVFSWAMGVTHHENGVQNVQAIANLALMRGMVGKAHAGLLPLRGHSNVQGMGSMGVTPQLKKAVFERLEETFDVTLPQTPGMDTMTCMERATDGGVRFAWCLGGNLYGSNPDSAFAEKALNAIDFTVFLSTTLNTGHVLGRGKESLILPVLARDEESQLTTQESMFNFVRVSDGGPARLEGPRSEVEVIAEIARRVLGDNHPVDWNSMLEHRRIREAIAKIIPGFEAMSRVENTKREFQIGGRTFHEPQFPTPSGKATLHVTEMAPPKAVEGTLRLMTIRSEGQFNTVVYEEEDLYRGQERRDVVLMHRDDRNRLGLDIDQPVTVSSNTGSVSNVLVREFDVRPGNIAMYYPEANALVPRALDTASKTPAFKNIAVTIQA